MLKIVIDGVTFKQRKSGSYANVVYFATKKGYKFEIELMVGDFIPKKRYGHFRISINNEKLEFRYNSLWEDKYYKTKEEAFVECLNFLKSSANSVNSLNIQKK